MILKKEKKIEQIKKQNEMEMEENKHGNLRKSKNWEENLKKY